MLATGNCCPDEFAARALPVKVSIFPDICLSVHHSASWCSFSLCFVVLFFRLKARGVVQMTGIPGKHSKPQGQGWRIAKKDTDNMFSTSIALKRESA